MGCHLWFKRASNSDKRQISKQYFIPQNLWQRLCHILPQCLWQLQCHITLLCLLQRLCRTLLQCLWERLCHILFLSQWWMSPLAAVKTIALAFCSIAIIKVSWTWSYFLCLCRTLISIMFHNIQFFASHFFKNLHLIFYQALLFLEIILMTHLSWRVGALST